MTPTILYTDPFYGQCPVQAEGTIDGYPFYFRSRGTRWTLYIGANRGEDPARFDFWAADTWRFSEEYRGEAYHVDGEPFCAGWAEPDECKAFVEQAASMWARRVDKAT